MTTSFDEAFDFDLNYLQQPNQNVVNDYRLDRQRKAVLIAKKKTIATDSLIKKYYAKKETLEQTELKLLTAKEECKKVCIDYKNILEKCTGLEKDIQTLKDNYGLLEAQYTLSQNQYEAITSHANQLQSLVKENELKIETLQIEKQLGEKKKEKEHTDVSEKSLNSLQKQNETLLKHILILKDVVLGKRKLQKHHKILLRKYKKASQDNKRNDDCHEGNYSSDETDFFEECSPPPVLDGPFEKPLENKNSQTETYSMFKGNNNDLCSTNSTNGVQEFENDSEDTGRGSSLAFSDGGKFFNSPDYYGQDSPHIEVDQSKVNINKTFTDASTSPAYSVNEKATSPIIFEDVALLIDVPPTSNPGYIITDSPVSSDIVTTKEKLKLVDCSTISDVERIHVACSPISDVERIHMACSPISDVERIHVACSPISDVERIHRACSPICDVERIHVGCSPICDVEKVQVACSPITFIDSNLLNYNNTEGNSLNYKQNEEHSSPRKSINNIKSVRQEQNYEKNKINPETSLFTDVSQHCIQEISFNDLSVTELEICDKNHLEKRCLEKHNSDNLIDKGNNDSEIEMILSSMRLDHRLLTPIPISPSKSKEKPKTKATSLSSKYHPNENHIVCLEAVKLREENKVLAESIANLSKEVTSIKSLQEKNLLINMSLLNHINKNGEICQSKNKNRFNKHNIEELDRNMVGNLDEIIYTENVKPQNQTSKEYSSCNISTTINTVNKDINLSDTVNKDVYLVDKVSKDVNLLEKCNEDVNLLDTVNNNKYVLDTVTEDVNLLGTVNDDENLPLSHFIPKEVCNANDVASITIYHDESNVKNVSNGDYYKINEICENKTKKPKRKLTKLQKLRHKMLPKYKIAENKFVNKSISRKKLKPIVVIRNKTEMDKLLNNKLAYEKAIKIMAEAKSKENEKNNSQRKHFNNKNNTNDHKNKTESSSITNLQFDKENVILVSVKNNNIKRVISEEKFDESKKEPDSKRKSIEKGEIKQKPIESKRKSTEEAQETEQRRVHSIRKSIEINKSTIDTSCENPPNLVKSNMRTTRSRSKLFDSEASAVLSPSKLSNNCTDSINQQTDKININNTINGLEKSPGLQSRKGFKRPSNEVPETVCKRILRSSKIKESIDESSDIKSVDNTIITTNNSNKNINNGKYKDVNNIAKRNIDDVITTKMDVYKKNITNQNKRDSNETNNMQSVEYSDLDMFSTSEEHSQSDKNDRQSELSNYPNSILCKTINTYKIKTKKYCSNKKTDQVSNSICKKLEEDIASIIELPADKHKQGMNKLVDDLQKFHVKSFISGFMKYLKEPARKLELFKTVNAPPAPLMTNAEQILLYVIKQLRFDNEDIVKLVLENIEYTLFQLNRTPEFDVVESMSHFYAIVCKYFGLKNRLRMFLLDAMYCLSFKVTTVVKQCLSVWMHILPLAHMGIAKNPLVTCLVYLLHFYKCEDRFKRVQDIRHILQHKFFYRITEWNDSKIIEMFKTAIKEIRDIPVEKKILRMALIILGKRQGPKWCDKNIINNMLLPIITKEKVSNLSREFAVSMLGPLLKPFPVHMKLSCETIVNQLLDMLDKNPSDSMKEAIFTSLIYMSKHNQCRVTQALLIWEPLQISADFQKHLKNYVREKSPRTWTKLIPELLVKYQVSDNVVY